MYSADRRLGDAELCRNGLLAARSNQVANCTDLCGGQLCDPQALSASRGAVNHPVGRVLQSRSPAKMTRVHASLVPSAARMSGLMLRRWRGTMNHLAYEAARKDPVPVNLDLTGISLVSREWPRQALVTREGNRNIFNEVHVRAVSSDGPKRSRFSVFRPPATVICIAHAATARRLVATRNRTYGGGGHRNLRRLGSVSRTRRGIGVPGGFAFVARNPFLINRLILGEIS